MRTYAVYQSLRYLLIIAGLLALIWMRSPGERLLLAFSLAELVLFFAMLPAIWKEFSLPSPVVLRQWLQAHIDFGLRSFLSNVLLQTNTRVDVLILGLFWSDSTVGIYSFAAMLIDGLYQLPVVLRTNYTPVLVRLIAEGRLDGLKAVVKKGVRFTYALMAAICLSTLLIFPAGVFVVSDGGSYLKSWPVLAILLTGLALSSGYIPFSSILLQSGRPGLHTLVTGAWVLSNILLNLVLVPAYGIWGAAAATALGYALLVFFVKRTTWSVLKVQI